MPNGYSSLPYLAGDGKRLIVTDVGTTDVGIFFDYLTFTASADPSSTALSDSSFCTIFTYAPYATGTSWRFCGSISDSNGIRFDGAWGTVYGDCMSIPLGSVDVFSEMEVLMGCRPDDITFFFFVNGIDGSDSYEVIDYPIMQPLCFFLGGFEGSTSSNVHYKPILSNGLLYRFSCFVGNVGSGDLRHDFHPCIEVSSDTEGLYDVVGGKFYPMVTPVEVYATYTTGYYMVKLSRKLTKPLYVSVSVYVRSSGRVNYAAITVPAGSTSVTTSYHSNNVSVYAEAVTFDSSEVSSSIIFGEYVVFDDGSLVYCR